VEDSALLTALKQRQPQALEQVFRTYAQPLFRLAAGILHDEQQADGVVQDTFLILIRQLDQFDGRSGIGTWLYRVAYHEALGRIRRANRVVDLVMEEDDSLPLPTHFMDWQTIPEAIFSSQEAATEMHKAIEALPETLRVVFILRDIHEQSTRQTAEILQLTESAVKVRLHRARLWLREALATYFEEYRSTKGHQHDPD
jgi:RNA polymerase sigma-70 factor, ECF subfamily